eukprot:GHVL01040331.1.p1 GENE.GHVL01040331.1~~GHVL01040331.1.p1  ORF type:complete len:144 (-),score=43.39 GHVL01040331.1:601-1032(-)
MEITDMEIEFKKDIQNLVEGATADKDEINDELHQELAEANSKVNHLTILLEQQRLQLFQYQTNVSLDTQFNQTNVSLDTQFNQTNVSLDTQFDDSRVPPLLRESLKPTMKPTMEGKPTMTGKKISSVSKHMGMSKNKKNINNQ